MSLVVASYLEFLLQYTSNWYNLEPLFALIILKKSDVFVDSNRMRLYLQIRLESIIIIIMVIIIDIVVVVVGQFANKKCAPSISSFGHIVENINKCHQH